MRTRLIRPANSLAILAFAVGLGLGCTAFGGASSRYAYFTPPAHDDAWSPKIAGWQRREVNEQGGAASTSPPVSSPSSVEVEATAGALKGGLRAKYFDFRAERKRDLARQVAEWIQAQARDFYVADGPIDHWATLEETLGNDGDDCDGLELLTFHALRDLGFDPNEVYRAIVYRPSDGQHHMVTLWFEDPEDPWVIDPTGAMTLGMPLMSQMPAWVPIKVFSDTVEYTVRPGPRGADPSSLASNE
jgi:hypothetical protein